MTNESVENAIVHKITQGDIRTASRLIRDLEDNLPQARETVMRLFPHTGKARIVGLTGAPGAGKSTLVDAMIDAAREENQTVGVLAVDPTSPFTGGAILGDRVRMHSHAQDPAVFVRSMAARDALGGLSPSIGDAIHVMDAMGKDFIMVETVGAGQQEIDIIHHAHTVILVLTPGMGDEIQAIKAGVMEIADIFVINKADRQGADRLENEILAMLHMVSEFPGDWRPPVIKIGNIEDTNSFTKKINELVTTADRHFQMLVKTGLLESRMQRKALMEIREALHHILVKPILNDLTNSDELKQTAQRIIQKEIDPYSAANAIIRKTRE